MHRTAQGVVIDFAELSDPGKDPSKQVNEDASAYAETPLGHLAVLCDGMGGHLLGQEASQLAIREVMQAVQASPAGTSPRAALEQAVQAAARKVYALGSSAPDDARPGATCVAALIHGRGVDVAHVGDSRCYLLRDGAATRLTRDHSVVQQLVDAGVISAEAALHHPDANQITRALGTTPEVEVELSGTLSIRPGDALLLCSDGLTDLISDVELSEGVTRSLASGAAVVCQQLVDLANQRGGHDNITLQLIEIVEAPVSPLARTQVGDDLTLPGTAPTVVGATVELPAEPGRGAGATQLLPALTPTVADELPRTERAPPTLPDSPSATLVAARAAPVVGGGRHLVAISAGVAGLILVAILVWWAAGGFAARTPPAPEPALLEPMPSQNVVLELKPQPDSGAVTPPPAAPSAKPSADAAVEDASPRP